MNSHKHGSMRILPLLLTLFLLLPRVNVLGADLNRDSSAASVQLMIEEISSDLMKRIPEPTFGSLKGDWAVFALARAGVINAEHPYFKAYLANVGSLILEAGESLKESGRISSTKSTENSRLIIALSANGVKADDFYGVDLIKAYSDFDWVKKQGINGVIYALLALDSGAYETEDPEFRQKCVDFLLENELADGGFALMGDHIDADISGMALQALAPYRDRADVQAAADRAFAALSAYQEEDGSFVTLGSWVPTAGSITQVITALAAWGRDPAADPGFVKSGHSTLDVLARFRVDDAANGHGFTNALKTEASTDDKSSKAGQFDELATLQGLYTLAAYHRFLKGETTLYDMSDVRFVSAGSLLPEAGTQSPDGDGGAPKPDDGERSWFSAFFALFTGVRIWTAVIAAAALLCAACLLVILLNKHRRDRQKDREKEAAEDRPSE